MWWVGVEEGLFRGGAGCPGGTDMVIVILLVMVIVVATEVMDSN